MRFISNVLSHGNERSNISYYSWAWKWTWTWTWICTVVLLLTTVLSEEIRYEEEAAAAAAANGAKARKKDAYETAMESMMLRFDGLKIDARGGLITQSVDLPPLPLATKRKKKKKKKTTMPTNHQSRRRVIAFNFDPIIDPTELFVESDIGWPDMDGDGSERGAARMAGGRDGTPNDGKDASTTTTMTTTTTTTSDVGVDQGSDKQDAKERNDEVLDRNDHVEQRTVHRNGDNETEAANDNANQDSSTTDNGLFDLVVIGTSSDALVQMDEIDVNAVTKTNVVHRVKELDGDSDSIKRREGDNDDRIESGETSQLVTALLSSNEQPDASENLPESDDVQGTERNSDVVSSDNAIAVSKRRKEGEEPTDARDILNTNEEKAELNDATQYQSINSETAVKRVQHDNFQGGTFAQNDVPNAPDIANHGTKVDFDTKSSLDGSLASSTRKYGNNVASDNVEPHIKGEVDSTESNRVLKNHDVSNNDEYYSDIASANGGNDDSTLTEKDSANHEMDASNDAWSRVIDVQTTQNEAPFFFIAERNNDDDAPDSGNLHGGARSHVDNIGVPTKAAASKYASGDNDDDTIKTVQLADKKGEHYYSIDSDSLGNDTIGTVARIDGQSDEKYTPTDTESLFKINASELQPGLDSLSDLTAALTETIGTLADTDQIESLSEDDLSLGQEGKDDEGNVRNTPLSLEPDLSSSSKSAVQDQANAGGKPNNNKVANLDSTDNNFKHQNDSSYKEDNFIGKSVSTDANESTLATSALDNVGIEVVVKQVVEVEAVVTNLLAPDEYQKDVLENEGPSPGLDKKTSVNDVFVHGLDDLHKFIEEVDPPDELDVGASGSSMQEVLMGQGVQILRKRLLMGAQKIRTTVTQLKERSAKNKRPIEHRNNISAEETVDGDKASGTVAQAPGSGPFRFAVVAVERNKEKLMQASRAVRKACARFVDQCQSILRTIFGMGDDDGDDDYDEDEDMSDLISKLSGVKSRAHREGDASLGNNIGVDRVRWNVDRANKAFEGGVASTESGRTLTAEELQGLISRSQKYARSTRFADPRSGADSE